MNHTIIKGIKVLSKDIPDLFERILGYEEYRDKIIGANGDPKILRDIFWSDLGDDYHWEFIEGEIVLRSGLSFFGASVGQNLSMTAWQFVTGKSIGHILTSRCVCSFPDNDFSPYMMYYTEEVGSKFTGDQNRFPIPDWIVEINDENTEENNRGIKFTDYAKQGVKEYWMVNLDDKSIEQYILDNNGFDFQGKIKIGTIESKTLTGFKMELNEIFDKEG